MDRGAFWAAVRGVTGESDMTEQVSTPVFPANELLNRGSPDPFLKFNYFVRAPHRTQINILLTCWPVSYNGYNSGTAR